MKLKERVSQIDRMLNELYPAPPIPLDHKDPYTLLVAVLLSAQCTDARVNKVTPKLFALADNPLEMSRQTVEAINEIVRPCGLAPRKAQAIQGLSGILIDKHGGSVPSTFDELEELPGVGHKTASVVMTQAFGHSTFPVDTHIHRPTLETDERKKRYPDGERPEEAFSQGTLEQITPANHLLRPRALSGSCMPRYGMHDLQSLLSGEEEQGKDEESLTLLHVHLWPGYL
jgi:endonuclease III